VHHHDSIGSAITGFISSITLGGLFGLITFGDVWQAFILGLFGAVGGWIGKELLMWIVKKSKSIINKRKTKQKKS